MADDKTALQLAEEIASRVHDRSTAEGTWWSGEKDPVEIMATEVLSVLREHGVWFCRLSETPEGTVQERLPMGDEDG